MSPMFSGLTHHPKSTYDVILSEVYLMQLSIAYKNMFSVVHASIYYVGWAGVEWDEIK